MINGVDVSKRLKTRFKRSKDFHKTIEALKKCGYLITEDYNEYSKLKTIRVFKELKELCMVVYEENEDVNAEYKQVIWGIYY